MFEERQIEEFKKQLDESTQSLAATDEQTSTREAFTAVVLEFLEENGFTSSPTICDYEEQSGRRLCRFSAYALSEDETSLQIFTTEYVDSNSSQTLPSSTIAKLAGRATQLFDRVRNDELMKFEQNLQAREIAERIKRGFSKIQDVTVVILSNGIAREKQIESLEIENIPISYEVIDLERLYRSAASGLPRDEIHIDFEKMLGRPIACLEMKPSPSEYQTYLLILPAQVLYQLYDEFGPRLLEFNVRSFLQARGNVNRGIRDTLRTQPERFMAYNNGIAATADEIEVSMFHGETTIKTIKGLQIVNGGQTTASLHRAKRMDKIDLSNVAVAMKLTKVKPEKLEEFVPLISRYSNTQNVIQVADLSANHPMHVQIERLSQTIWTPSQDSKWFYERTRGSYEVALLRYGTTQASKRKFKQENPASQKFSKTDLVKYLNAFDCQPFNVSRGAQKNFALFMSSVQERYGDGWKPSDEFFKETIAKAIIFKSCERIVRREKFPAYRANISAYLASLFAFQYNDDLVFTSVWSEQSISNELEALLKQWSHIVNDEIVRSAGGRNVTEWCKKEECWEILSGLELPQPSAQLPEFAQIEPSETTIAEQHSENDAISQCMQLTGKEWFEVHAWGAETGILNKWEKGVAHTLSGYAAEGWQKKPSEKQANIGTRAIQLARRHGVINNPPA